MLIKNILLDIPFTFLLYSVFAFASEIGLFILIFTKHINNSVLFFLHLSLAAIFLILTFIKKNQMRDQGRYMIYFSLLFITMGVFGLLIGFITLVFYHLLNANTADFAEWIENLFPKTHEDKSDKLYEKIIFGQDEISDNISTEPFQDIMIYGTVRQKQLALVKMTRYFIPEFAPVILSALQDEDNCIRVQAAVAVAKLEDTFLKKYKMLEQRTFDNPESLVDLRSFADACNEYANSNLLDAERAKFVRQKIIQVYGKCIKFLPGDYEIRLFLAQIYLIDGTPELALKSIIASIKLSPIMFPNQIRLYLDILYKMKFFEMMQEFAKEQLDTVKENYKKDYDLVSLLNLWANGYYEQKIS